VTHLRFVHRRYLSIRFRNYLEIAATVLRMVVLGSLENRACEWTLGRAATRPTIRRTVVITVLEADLLFVI